MTPSASPTATPCIARPAPPSMATVTLLALSNDAPDVFASLATLRSNQPCIGLGTILSVDAFVSAFVVRFVAIYVMLFSFDHTSFVRDMFFYLIASLSLFDVYLRAKIFVWQALGFVGFYVFFVGFVFCMDFGGKEGKGLRILDCESVGWKLGVLEEEEEEKKQQQDDGGGDGLGMIVLQNRRPLSYPLAASSSSLFGDSDMFCLLLLLFYSLFADSDLLHWQLLLLCSMFTRI